MQLLKELLAIHEAPEVPVELKDIIAAFPKNHGKALEKLWGGRRLVWHGMRFFDHDDLGEAYTKSMAAVEETVDDQGGIEVEQSMELRIHPSMLADEDEGDEDRDDNDAPMHAEIEWKDTLKYSDMQEVYLGYSPKRDKLYIGFDAWGNGEEEFNQAFDEAFEEATGVPYDHDNEGHHEVYNELWQELQRSKMGFYGVIFEITDLHDSFHAEEAMAPMAGGFYRGTFSTFKRQHPDVVDLRLD